MLEEKTVAPDFSLPDAAGTIYSLSQYRGKWVLVYFYPKDNTPGCTQEACTLRDVFPQYKNREIVILGISKDSRESHADFSTTYELPFTLLSDSEQKVITAYGAKGDPYTKRISYLIAPDGTIAKAYPAVDPATHADEVLLDVAKLSQK